MFDLVGLGVCCLCWFGAFCQFVVIVAFCGLLLGY